MVIERKFNLEFRCQNIIIVNSGTLEMLGVDVDDKSNSMNKLLISQPA